MPESITNLGKDLLSLSRQEQRKLIGLLTQITQINSSTKVADYVDGAVPGTRWQNTFNSNVQPFLVVDSGQWAFLAQNWGTTKEILQGLSGGAFLGCVCWMAKLQLICEISFTPSALSARDGVLLVNLTLVHLQCGLFHVHIKGLSKTNLS